MADGQQEEHICIIKVAPERQHFHGLALQATDEDHARVHDICFNEGEENGPPIKGQDEEDLEFYSRLWGICFGRPRDWLPGDWGALVITRILEGGALSRWN